MEIVKNEPDGHAHPDEPIAPQRPGWLARLLAWRSSTGDRAADRDPTLWMHRDVTT